MKKERIEVFFDTLRPELPDYIINLEKEALRNEVPVIRRGTRDLLRYLLRTGKPARVLEVGTAVGYSALFMKECLPAESRITTIEKVEMRLAEARKNLRKYDPEERIRLVEGDATQILEQLAKEEEHYDFIFMDAAKGQYIHFLPDILRLLKPKGLLVSDNIFQEGEIMESKYAIPRRNRTIYKRMRQYLDVLTRSDLLETVILPVGDGVTLSFKKV